MGWYDDQFKRKSKYFKPEYKKYIKPFQTRKFAELNSDVRTVGSVIDIPWNSFKQQYLDQKQIEGISASSIKDILNTIRLFEKSSQIASTAAITRSSINAFITDLQKRSSTRIDKENSKAGEKVYYKLSPDTINKHIRYIRAMISWGAKSQFIAVTEIKNVKADD